MNAEKETAILIKLDKNRQLTVEAKGMFLPEGIQLCLAAIEVMCKNTLARTADEKLRKSLEEDMYDMINMGASTLLNKVFPEIEMRPDLTVDALMQAENELLTNEDKMQEYADAYADSAQSKKDVYEHSLAKANLAAQNMNREQRRKAGVKKNK